MYSKQSIFSQTQQAGTQPIIRTISDIRPANLQQQQYIDQWSQQQQQQLQQQQSFQQQPSFQQQQLQQQQTNQLQQGQQNVQYNQTPEQQQQFQQQGFVYQPQGNQPFQQIQGPYYTPYVPVQDYTNPDAIPDKIDLKFYQIDVKKILIKSFLFLKFSNSQILYAHHNDDKKLPELEAIIILKNLREFDFLTFSTLYQIQTDNGFWLCYINELDRAIMSFYDQNYPVDIAYHIQINFEQIVNDPEIAKQTNGTDIQNSTKQKIDEMCAKYEAPVQNNNIKLNLSQQIFTQTHFSQSFQQQISMNFINKVDIEKQEAPIDRIFDVQNIWKEMKDKFQSITSVCICILLVIIVCLLLYQFVIKGMILLMILDIVTMAQQTNVQPIAQHKYIKHKNI